MTGSLKAEKRVPYDQVWAKALALPLVWESDLKAWIESWKKEGKVRIDGLGTHRVPQLGKQHVLVWIG